VQVSVQAVAHRHLVWSGVVGADDVRPHHFDLRSRIGLGLLRGGNGGTEAFGAVPHHFQQLLNGVRDNVGALGGFERVPNQCLYANFRGWLVPLLDEVDLYTREYV